MAAIFSRRERRHPHPVRHRARRPARRRAALPLVYDELRKLAAQKLAQEKPGQTLQATALVHEAYLRLVDDGRRPAHWNSRGHFFAAAAEAMRRILVDKARRKQADQTRRRPRARDRSTRADRRRDPADGRCSPSTRP